MSKILIIDDDLLVRKMLNKLLSAEDYEVLEASNGLQGLNLIKENMPDLIITDLIMPDKEGLETISEIRKLKISIPIIAISGGGVSEPTTYLTLAKKMGATRVFSKPFDNIILVSTIKELLS